MRYATSIKKSFLFLLVVGTEEYVADYKNQVFISSFKLNKIYPNPFKGLFNLRFSIPWNNLQNLNIRLVNLKGRTIYKHHIDDGLLAGEKVLSVNVNSASQLSSGVYIIQIVAKGGFDKHERGMITDRINTVIADLDIFTLV